MKETTEEKARRDAERLVCCLCSEPILMGMARHIVPPKGHAVRMFSARMTVCQTCAHKHEPRRFVKPD